MNMMTARQLANSVTHARHAHAVAMAGARITDEELAEFAVSGEIAAIPPTGKAEFLRAASWAHADRVRQIGKILGTAGKTVLTPQERDRIAAGLLHTLQSAAGKTVKGDDASIARAIVTKAIEDGGARVAGEEVGAWADGATVLNGADEMGISVLKTLGYATGIPAALWVGKKAVQGLGAGAKAVGRALGIVKKPKSAAQRRQAALVAAAKKRAAAAARIRAAEKKHEAAIVEREQARRIAEEEAAALDAEAAAQEAEAIAIEADAMKDVADVPAIEGEFAPAGVFDAVLGEGLDSGVAHGVFDRVLGEDADAEVAAELASLVRMHGAGGR